MSIVEATDEVARSKRALLTPAQLSTDLAKGAHPDGADVAALVHVLGKDRAILADDQGLFLDRTWRLHPSICGFTSELYYEGRLRSIDALERQRLDGDTPFAGAGLFLVEVPHEGNQSRSDEEIDAVERIVQHLLAGTRWTDHEACTRPLEPSDILVVAPYNAQVSALRRTLAPLGVTRVGTVDKFQGQECPDRPSTPAPPHRRRTRRHGLPLRPASLQRGDQPGSRRRHRRRQPRAL